MTTAGFRDYRTDIDGLRALAVIPVLLFHAEMRIFSGGFVGVDVFFVISGFLITRMIIDEPQSFRIISFYERRARRIFPALFVMLAIIILVGSLLCLPPDLVALSKAAIAAVLFCSNIASWIEVTNYFGSPAKLQPLLHVWSLGVEEQFYIFFPMLMIFLGRWCRHRLARILLMIACTLVSLAFSEWSALNRAGVAFYLLPSRAWELMVGATLAEIGEIEWSTRAQHLTGFLGAGLILAPVFTYNQTMAFPGVAATLPCAGAMLVLSGRGGIVRRSLSFAPLVGIGKASYSLYLWHWPVLVFARYLTIRSLTPVEAVSCLGLSGVVAYLSLKYVERPFRDSSLFTRVSIGICSLVSGSVVMSAALIVLLNSGFPGRFPDYIRSGTEASLAEYNNGKCFFSQDIPWSAEECRLSKTHDQMAILWGDSYAAHLVPGLKSSANALPFDMTQLTSIGCLPLFDYYVRDLRCRKIIDRARANIMRLRPPVVLIAGAWFVRQDSIIHLKQTIEQIHSWGINVVVVGQSPVFDFFNPGDMVYRTGASSNFNYFEFLRVPSNYAESLNSLAIGAPVVDPMPFLCTEKSCSISIDGQLLYIDDGHLTSFGSRFIVSKMSPTLGRLMGESVTPTSNDPLPDQK